MYEVFIYSLITELNEHFLACNAACVSETVEIVENSNTYPEAGGHDFNIPTLQPYK